MSLGVCLYAGWFGILIASELVAGSHMNRGGWHGVVRGFAGIIGAFLCWAFISAYSGAVEMPDYVNSRAFGIAVATGVIGFLLFVMSCVTLAANTYEPSRGGAA